MSATVLGFSLSTPVTRGESRWAWFDIFTPTLDCDSRAAGDGCDIPESVWRSAERLGEHRMPGYVQRLRATNRLRRVK